MLPLPYNARIEASRLDQIDELASRWRHLQPVTTEMKLAQQSYDEDFLVRMAYNSNAIEGSTLTLADTEIVYEGEFVPDKPGRDQIAARGIFEGSAFIDELFQEGACLDENILRDLHERCALDLQPAARGMYRMAPAIIRASRTVPTAPAKIRDEMKALFDLYEEAQDKLHPLISIAWFHAAFEDIHPFADGNGRTGRLWMNAQLRDGLYSPITIKVDHSAEYKRGLESWQADDDPQPFVELALAAEEEELQQRIDFLSQGPIVQNDSIAAIRHGGEVLDVVRMNPRITSKQLASILGLSERQIQRIIRALQEAKLIKRVGAKKNGTWQIE